MMRALSAVLIAFGSAGVSAQEPSRDLQTIYRIQAAPAPEGERELASKEWVIKQPLLPDGLSELVEPVALKPDKPPIAAGTRMLAVQSQIGEVRCITDIRKIPHVMPPCLVDTDRDGSFDAWFSSRTNAYDALIMIEGRAPKKLTSLAKPVPYRNIDPALHEPALFVGVQRRNYFNIYGNESFMIVYGSEQKQGEITMPVTVKSAAMPKELEVLGARFTAISETAGRLKVRVDAPMPPQPFGITTTTSYMFIPGP
jgi:hypothetical protein